MQHVIHRLHHQQTVPRQLPVPVWLRVGGQLRPHQEIREHGKRQWKRKRGHGADIQRGAVVQARAADGGGSVQAQCRHAEDVHAAAANRTEAPQGQG